MAASGKCKYFNATLQTSEGQKNAVCFSPEKRPAFARHEDEKSPVKITRIRLSSKFNNDVIIDQTSKITPVTENVGFQYVDTTPSLVNSLLSLNQISSDQLVTIKAKVIKVFGSKKIQTKNNPSSALTKQEMVIGDPTACVKLILWEESVDVLKEGVTYLLRNLRLRRETGGSIYLNTPKSGQFSSAEVNSFSDSVVEDMQMFSTTEMSASIIGVESISNYQPCMKCGRKTAQLQGTALKCQNCNMVQKAVASKKQWFIRCLFAQSGKDGETISLAIFHENMKCLVDMMTPPLSLSSVTTDELTIELLSMPEMKITYDSISKKLISVSQIDI